MGLKDKVFGRFSQEPQEYTVDDLMVLERYEDAEEILQERLKRNPYDLRSRLKLADLLMRSKRAYQAVDEYIAVADGYTSDGFYDKALALLSKVDKLIPGYEKTRIKIEKIKRAKHVERGRTTAIEAVLKRHDDSLEKVGATAFELQQLWQNLSDSPVLHRLGDEQLRRLFGALKIVHYRKITLIAERGKRFEELFLVAKGAVEVSIEKPDGKKIVLRELDPGDLFGESGLLEHRSWPATYMATPKTVLLRLTPEALEKALAGNANPKELLDALRFQALDSKVSSVVYRTEK